MVPSNLRQRCPQIQELTDGKNSTVIRWTNDFIFDYGDCADRHQSTILIIDEYNKRLINGN